MSREVRKQIAYWVMLILGIAIWAIQFKKYYEDTLECSVREFTMFFVAVCMVVRPLVLLEVLRQVLKFKYGKDANVK